MLTATMLIVWICLALGVSPVASAETPRHPDELDLAPIEFSFPQPQETQLACGIPVYLFQNRDLPLLCVEIRFRMGRRYQSGGQFAAWNTFHRLWDSGGTAEVSADSLDKRLAELDVTISAGVRSRSGFVRAFMVSEDLRAGLPLWRDILLHPGFEEQRLERARAHQLKSLQSINNNPRWIADTHFDWLLYGPDYPGARTETRASIESVHRDDLVRLHQRFVHPENAIIGISGDFDTDEILNYLDELLVEWPSTGSFEPPELASWVPHPQPGVYLLPGDYEQSQVRIGHVVEGLTEVSPEEPLADLLDVGLGWGRVFYRARREGLSYGTATRMETGELRAKLYGFGGTQNPKTTQLLQLIHEEVDRLHTEPLTDEELKSAKTFIIGDAIAGRETARKVIEHKLTEINLDWPKNHFETHIESLQQASPEDIEAFVEKYVSFRDSLVVLVLGNPDTFEVPLDSLGLGPATELEPVVFGE